MFRRLNYGAVPGYAPICLDTNDPKTVTDGLLQRLCRKGNIPDDARLEKFSKFVSNFVDSHFSKVTPLPFEAWLETTSYNEARKQELRNVYVELKGGPPTQQQSQHVDTFGKSESYPNYKMLRMINSRSDYFKVFSGPYFKAIEDEVYKLPQFIKHTPVPDRPAKVNGLRKDGRHYFATDHTAFEAAFRKKVMMACECILYRKLLANYPVDADRIIKVITGRNALRNRMGMRAYIEARRMSGEMNTSLGNGFSNLMSVLFLVWEKNGIVDGFVEGDDGIFSSTVPIEPEDYNSLGFTVKLEKITDPSLASFCGIISAPDHTLLKDPRKFLMNFGWTSSFISAGHEIMGQLLRAKALSACYEAPQCPIIGCLARKALTKTEAYSPRFVEDQYHRVPHDALAIAPYGPSMVARETFAAVFGVSPELQLEIERCIDNDRLDSISQLLPPGNDSLHYSSRYLEIT